MNIKKCLVITGGSSGIGAAIIQKFLSQNYNVYNLDIKSSGINHQNYCYLHTDVSNEYELIKSLEYIKTKTLSINTLIPNAGKHLSANIENTTIEQLYEILNLNLLSAYWLIQNSIALMKNHGGSIITIGSDQCSIAKKNSTAYGITKGALLQLTKSVAIDYAEYNIRANCLGVGTINTPLYKNAIKKYSDKSGIPLSEIEQSEAKEQPLGRVGLPEEVAALAYFLTLPEASYITGALMPIDGGYIAK